MTETLENLIDLPDREARGAASGDLLSHVLAQIRLTGDRVQSLSIAPTERLDLDAGLGHVLVVAEGALHAESGVEQPGTVDTGDLVLLPRGPGENLLVASGAGAVVIACRFWFDPYSLRGMISALPQRIHIRRAEGAGWLEGIMPFLMIEAAETQPGAALMISRIIDLLVIRTLRTWVHLGRTSGWLGGLSDARIARALKLVHEKPLRRWSIEALAEAAGMSRSSFCERFIALVGRSPARYQNEWRLNLARDMLGRRDARVGEVGLRVGYRSEAAFSRAYKALFGWPPRDEFHLPSETGSHG
ncbi:AraC family transcriptional regulator [Hansschlegelia zhihuaiae]|uniref:AraC family transcriptional regulator n=1 Tax=Hansschlegelia zhihuaiae TaxID=405005 RepID=A0A4Q0M565_9HYPH|nr:AraC family transcriptional regulator [Hansschlegelia zhihuaiae]RXF67933.1 AraC family transcriptional regulator [Hansschlegelia zhihuaiae]